ncbi:MAG: EAL domain-containing protein [Actinobacteria bacterium]|nr:EAL domain-containing protein [Actinomycetota bacterium]
MPRITSGRPPTLAGRALLVAVTLRPAFSWAAVVVMLAAQWLVNALLAGAGVIVPHGYYVPVLFVAGRFGHLSALVVAVVAGALAGPFTYQELATATPQSIAEWVTRTAFFVVIGQGVAFLARHARPGLQAAAALAVAERELLAGLAGGELRVEYQPVLDLPTGRLYGFEALVRWEHPDGLRGPDEFLPVAEATGHMREIGDVVFAEACTQAERWRRAAIAAGRVPPTVAVNLAAECVTSDDLVPRVERALHTSGLPPELLCVEVTEGDVVADLEGSCARLRELRRRGIHVAIDDFGAGQASLSYLHRLPANVLKLDRSFVAELQVRDGDARPIVEGVLGLAKRLRMPVVAEGIECEAARIQLAEMGCLFGQGYHLGHPVRADELDPAWVEQLPLPGEPRPTVTADRLPGHW